MIRPEQENRNFLINDQKPTRIVIAENLHRLKQTSKSGGAFINLCVPAFSPRDLLQKISTNCKTSLVTNLWGVPGVTLLRNT